MRVGAIPNSVLFENRSLLAKPLAMLCVVAFLYEEIPNELGRYLHGSRGRTRTFNHTVNSRVLYH
jgi:hypothetical protein